MELVIISTTIHGEKGYLPFDRLASDSQFSPVTFVVSGDKKSLPFDASKFRCPVEYLDVEAQARFRCSEAIGWNKIMRRNTALLRAIELDPDVIMTIDDDNHPEQDFFTVWYEVLTRPATRLVYKQERISPQGPWYNYLRSSDAKIQIYPRGFPIRYRGGPPCAVKEVPPINPEAIGLYQGISLGDCDIDAITRVVYPDKVTRIGEKNYCVRDLYSPYNSQNTVFRKILFPMAFVWPFCGRYDDIYASFVWQRLLFNNGLSVHVGDAINIQERGNRDILREIRDETEGYLNAHLVWESLNKIDDTDPLLFLNSLLKLDNEIIQRQFSFIQAFIEDLREIEWQKTAPQTPSVERAG
jgi:hypothetical protein